MVQRQAGLILLLSQGRAGATLSIALKALKQILRRAQM
tara:strand:- start:354 stop:467 length:114 start_codon:yes stop_codon:yes gene_type:complete